ncbi:MAG: hypothetical protein WCD79_17320 [Chthoniobacteraceae bacterium]
MYRKFTVIGLILLAGTFYASASDFFTINSIKFIASPPKDGPGYRKVVVNGNVRTTEFTPYLEVYVSAQENTQSAQLTGKVYFFDDNNNVLTSRWKPSNPMPVMLYKGKPERLWFEVPKLLLNTRWNAVVIFGDKTDVKSACFPVTASDFLLNYPDKNLVSSSSAKPIEHKAAMDPVIEHVVKTKNPKMPQITLFLRPPKGITSPSEVKGVLAICVLAGGLDEIKRDLGQEEMPGDYNGLFAFANKNKLAILAWGSRSLWDPKMNNEDMQRAQAKEMDESFDTVAEAWERGVKELCETYGLPNRDFLLWGMCGSAQWAHRLCLRKPAYFLAIDIHMPGSFDQPTPEASEVLWCLTTGEREGGYERSKRFVKACREMGYPIVYKAIVGLGHSNHPDATALGFKFFEFALTLKDQRDARDKQLADVFSQPAADMSAPSQRQVKIATQPWPEAFQHPPYYGDLLNQVVFPSKDVNLIPAAFRITLPNKEIADIWARSR